MLALLSRYSVTCKGFLLFLFLPFSMGCYYAAHGNWIFINLLLPVLFGLAFFVSSLALAEEHSKKVAWACLVIQAIVSPLITVFSIGNETNLVMDFIIGIFINCFVSIFSSTILTGIYRKTHGEQWYRQTYAHWVSVEDEKHKFRCFHCNSGYLKGKNLMNKTYTRKMFCGDCDKTLFYTAE